MSSLPVIERGAEQTARDVGRTATGHEPRVPGLAAVLRCEIVTSSLRCERGAIRRELFGTWLGLFHILGRLHKPCHNAAIYEPITAVAAAPKRRPPGPIPRHAISRIVTGLVQCPEDCKRQGSKPSQSRGMPPRSRLNAESADRHFNLATGPGTRHPDVGRTARCHVVTPVDALPQLHRAAEATIASSPADPAGRRRHSSGRPPGGVVRASGPERRAAP